MKKYKKQYKVDENMSLLKQAEIYYGQRLVTKENNNRSILATVELLGWPVGRNKKP